MWIRASYTVENAVIVPVFSMIIILIISFTCNIHDEIIKRKCYKSDWNRERIK